MSKRKCHCAIFMIYKHRDVHERGTIVIEAVCAERAGARVSRSGAGREEPEKDQVVGVELILTLNPQMREFTAWISAFNVA